MTPAQRREWLWAIDRSLRIWIHRLETEQDDARPCPLCNIAERNSEGLCGIHRVCDLCIVPQMMEDTCHEAVGPWGSNRDAGHAVMALLMLRTLVEEVGFPHVQ